MGIRISKYFGTNAGANYSGGGMPNFIETEIGVLYWVHIDNASNDAGYKKSTDYGLTWGSFVALRAGTTVAINSWYDGWSGITASHLIHVAYTDSGTDDTYYRTIDTANSDTLGTERVVFAGASTATGGALSITRARGGNVMVATMIDAGAEYDTRKTVDLGANWTSPAEVFESTTDQIILLPGWNADTQDVMAIYWDADTDEISVKRYDDSADSWAETSIATTMLDNTATGGARYFSAAVDLINSQNVLVAWSGRDTANADLRCFTINDTSITEKTNVVLNSVDDQAFCGINIDKNGYWNVLYCGSSNGAETYSTLLNVYLKQSIDGGTTWDSEVRITDYSATIIFMQVIPISYINSFYAAYSNVALFFNIPYSEPQTSYQIGI